MLVKTNFIFVVDKPFRTTSLSGRIQIKQSQLTNTFSFFSQDENAGGDVDQEINSANGWMCQASLKALHLNFSIAYVRSVEFQMETYSIICRRGAQNQVISSRRGLLRNAEQSRLKNARIELLFRPLLRQGNTSV